MTLVIDDISVLTKYYKYTIDLIRFNILWCSFT